MSLQGQDQATTGVQLSEYRLIAPPERVRRHLRRRSAFDIIGRWITEPGL